MARTCFGAFWIVSFLSIFAFPGGVGAAPSSLTYQGRIVSSSGAPLQHASVSFQFIVANPSGSCVIYKEQVDGINMTNSNGIFDVKIGASHSYPSSPTFSILDAFNNGTSFVCDGGVVYNPTAGDGRLLKVQFYDGVAWRSISPDSVIRSVPFAGYSESANKLGSYGATDFILKTAVNGNASCDSGSFLTWNASTQTFGCALGSAGSGTVTEIFSANSYLTIANATTTPLITLNVGSGPNTVAAGNDVRLSNARVPTGTAGGDLSGNYPNPSVSKIQGVGVDFATAPTPGQVLSFNGTNWVAESLPASNPGTVTSVIAGTGLTGGTITSSGTIGLGAALTGLNNVSTNGYIQRTGAGIYSTTSGSVSASSNNLVLRDGSGVSSFYGVGISGATSGSIILQAPSISSNYSLTLPDAQGGVNQVLSNDGSGILNWVNVPLAPGAACGAGNVLTYNGSAFTCVPDQVGSAGGGIATLNSQTGSSQSFATGTTGNAPGWSSASDVHTLNIPFARNASVTAGLISKTEYDTFNSKQSALGFTPLNPANNLSELSDVSAARSNLGLGSAATKLVPASGDAAVAEVVLGNDSRLTNSRAPSGAAGGDLAGTYPNPEVSRLKGTSLSVTSLTSGDVLKYNGTNWINAALGISDIAGLSTALNGKIDQSQISGTCSTSKTLSFSSVTGTWTCSDIAISGTQVTYASQSAKTFFAAPTGGAGAPGFRTIASTDLPSSITDALWTSSGANIYRSGGLVGIGTATPERILHLASGTATVILEHTSASANFKKRYFNSSGGSMAFGSFSDDLTVTTEHMRITGSGRLGIGTANPLAPLHVQRSGETTITNADLANTEHYLFGDISGTSGKLWQGINVQGKDGGNFVSWSNRDDTSSTLGALKFAYAKRSTTDENEAAVAGIYGDNTTADATSGGRLYFATRSAGATGSVPTRMTLSPDGNLGIGTTIPTKGLDIHATTSSAEVVLSSTLGGNTGNYIKFMTSRPDLSKDTSSTSYGSGNKSWAVGAMNDTHATYPGALIFMRNDDVSQPIRMTLSNGGNLGIGTTTPSSRMQIVNDGGPDGADDIRVDTYGTTSPGILFYRARGTASAPTTVLDGDYMGSVLMTGYNGSAWTRAGAIVSVADNDWTSTLSTNNAYLSFRTTSAGTNTQRMMLSSTGKLGLNTSTPNSYLSINGSGSTGWQLAVHGQGNTTSTYGIVHRDSANANVFWTRDDGASYFSERIGVGTSPDTNYAIRATGNVYIAGSGVNCTIGNGTGGTACSSDRRLKENIIEIPDSLERILRIRGVEFDWNKVSGREGQHAVGVIAQEVEKEFPTLVHKEPTSGFLTVDYAGLVTPLIQAVKELYENINGQSRELASVKEELKKERQRNDDLELRLKGLEKQVSEMQKKQ
ncbi:tail fiber domain-containing protein [Bdellovibrio bacteriovorus]|uniref:tail fiber domain-containing protein n=1 Tax=Bdellovibrio bacteriovorus TaxID=959 RepID=UPI0035A95E41